MDYWLINQQVISALKTKKSLLIVSKTNELDLAYSVNRKLQHHILISWKNDAKKKKEKASETDARTPKSGRTLNLNIWVQTLQQRMGRKRMGEDRERDREGETLSERHRDWLRGRGGARSGPAKGRNERNAVRAVKRLTHPYSFSSGRLPLIRPIQSWLMVTRPSGR